MFRKTLATLALPILAAASGTAQADPGQHLIDFSSGAGGWEGINLSEPIEGWGT